MVDSHLRELSTCQKEVGSKKEIIANKLSLVLGFNELEHYRVIMWCEWWDWETKVGSEVVIGSIDVDVVSYGIIGIWLVWRETKSFGWWKHRRIMGRWFKD